MFRGRKVGLCAAVHKPARCFSGRCGRRLLGANQSSMSSGAVPLAAGRPIDQQRRTSEACFVRGTVVRGCARGHVGWQKLSGGVGLRRSLSVAAESETWGLAPSGKPQRAKGRRESALNALRSEWRKGSNEPPGDGRRFGSSKSSPFYGVAGGAALIERAKPAQNVGEARAVTGRQSSNPQAMRREENARRNCPTASTKWAERRETHGPSAPPGFTRKNGVAQPHGARVLFFEMWVADIVRTHLWLVPSSRRKARARSSLSATGAEVPLMGRRGAGRANGCEGRPACVNNQEGRSGRR